MPETLANGKIIVSLEGTTVYVGIECRNLYEAHSLYDDVLARLQAGEKVAFKGRKS